MSDPLPDSIPHPDCHADCARVHVQTAPDKFMDLHVIDCPFIAKHAYDVEVDGTTYKCAPRWLRRFNAP